MKLLNSSQTHIVVSKIYYVKNEIIKFSFIFLIFFHNIAKVPKINQSTNSIIEKLIYPHLLKIDNVKNKTPNIKNKT